MYVIRGKINCYITDCRRPAVLFRKNYREHSRFRGIFQRETAFFAREKNIAATTCIYKHAFHLETRSFFHNNGSFSILSSSPNRHYEINIFIIAKPRCKVKVNCSYRQRGFLNQKQNDFLSKRYLTLGDASY